MPRIDYIITARDETKRAVKSAETNLKSFQKTHADTIKNLKEVGLPAAGFFTAFVLGTKKIVDESNKAENALAGLRSVATAFIGDAEGAQAAAEDLAADGLLTLAEAAQGVKNLLARGFSLPEATQLMNNFKDSAAFGRQGALGFGEAVVGATEGLKNQMSQMVDNAGVTKNLSNIHKEYAASIGTTIGKLTEAQKREAELQGIMQETMAQRGDAAKLTELFSGKQAQLEASTSKLAAALGDKVKPVLSEVLDIINTVVNAALEFTEQHETATTVILALAGAIGGGAGLLTVLAGLATLLPAITAGVSLLGGAVTLATGPIGLITLGVAAAIAIFLKFRKQLGDLVEYIVKFVVDKLAVMIEKLAGLVKAAEGLPFIGDKAKEMGAKLLEAAKSAREFGEGFQIGADEAADSIEATAETTENSVDRIENALADGARASAAFADQVQNDLARINSAQGESAELQERMSDRRRAAALAEAEFFGRMLQEQIDKQTAAANQIINQQNRWAGGMQDSFSDIRNSHGQMWDGVEDRADSAYGNLQSQFGDNKLSLWMQIIEQIQKVMDAAINMFEGFDSWGYSPDLQSAAASAAISTGTYSPPATYGPSFHGLEFPDSDPMGKTSTVIQHFHGTTLIDRAQGLDAVQTLRDLEGEYDNGVTFAGAA